VDRSTLDEDKVSAESNQEESNCSLWVEALPSIALVVLGFARRAIELTNGLVGIRGIAYSILQAGKWRFSPMLTSKFAFARYSSAFSFYYSLMDG